MTLIIALIGFLYYTFSYYNYIPCYNVMHIRNETIFKQLQVVVNALGSAMSAVL